MSEISETEIKAMTKEQNYMRGYKDGKSDVLDKISAEIKEVQNLTSNDKGYEEGWKEALRYSLLQLEKYKKEGAE